MCEIGDVIRGLYFPTNDGNGKRTHYAVVLAFRYGVPILNMGASLKVAEEVIAKRSHLLVVSPKTAAQHRRETGLVKPTLFDLEGGRKLVLTRRHRQKWKTTVVGNLKNVGAWRRLLKRCG